MRTKMGDLQGALVHFYIAEYHGYDPVKINYHAVIYNRPNNMPNYKVAMDDWDDLTYFIDELIPKYEVNYPLPVVRYDKNFKLIPQS